MAFIEWDDAYKVGVGKFDQQHQRIVAMIDQVHEASESGKERQVLMTVLSNLAGYTKTHFSDEERMMEEHDYPFLSRHRAEHQRLIAELADLYRDFFTSNRPLGQEVFDFLNRWLFVHILSEDKQYSAFFAGRQVR